MKKIFNAHPVLSILCFSFCALSIIYLFCGFEFVIGFKKIPIDWNNFLSNWYTFFLTIGIALLIYLFVDKKTSDKISEIKNIEDNIQEKTKNISEITTKIQSNVNKLESSVQKILEIQDQIAFETEKNRLMNFFQYYLPEVENRNFRGNISAIFYEREYYFLEIDKSNRNLDHYFKVKFMKELNNRLLPKMRHPFSRDGDFPYFCVQVTEKDQNKQKNQNRIELNKYYYLSYICSPSNVENTGWYMAENYPIQGSDIHKGFKVIFSSPSFVGSHGPSADEFCKNY